MSSPNYGVKFKIEAKPQPIDQVTVQREEEMTNIMSNQEAYGVSAPRNRMYTVNRTGVEDPNPCYNSTLALAMEELPQGVTLEALWKI